MSRVSGRRSLGRGVPGSRGRWVRRSRRRSTRRDELVVVGGARRDRRVFGVPVRGVAVDAVAAAVTLWQLVLAECANTYLYSVVAAVVAVDSGL